jgi:protein-S-isoprenylcysteine O-methyltransferase Ste14
MVDVATRSPGRLHLEEIRFLVFGRALPAALFALLGYRVLLNLVAQASAISGQPSFSRVYEGPLPTALYLCFCAIPVGIYLVRPRPRARDGRVVARACAFMGTLMLLGVGALPASIKFSLPAAASAAATPLTIIAFSIALFGLAHLRRNLSIIPEARQLVMTGPYRWIRHPLYLGEIIAAIAAVLANPGLWPVVTLLPFVCVQLLRAHFEEQLLVRTFPQYAAYRMRTWRLIPFVW